MSTAAKNAKFVRLASRALPVAFALGAGMELFMIKTGFCEHASLRTPCPACLRSSPDLADDVAKRKEAERRADLMNQREQMQRMQEAWASRSFGPLPAPEQAESAAEPTRGEQL